MPYKSLKKRLIYARKWRELHPAYMTAYARWLSAHERHPNVPKPGPVPVKKIKGRVKISLAKVNPSLIQSPHAKVNSRARRNAVAPRAEAVAVNGDYLAGTHSVDCRPVRRSPIGSRSSVRSRWWSAGGWGNLSTGGRSHDQMQDRRYEDRQGAHFRR